MIKLKPTFKYTTKIILMLSLFFVVAIVFMNSWNTSSDKKVKEFFLYGNKGKSDYLHIQDFTILDTLASMEKVGFVKGDFLVGFSLENLFEDSQKPSFLEFSNPYFYKLSLYKVRQDGVLDLINEAGTSVGSSTPLIYPKPLFEFTYEDVKDAQFFAVIQSKDPIGFELVLE